MNCLRKNGGKICGGKLLCERTYNVPDNIRIQERRCQTCKALTLYRLQEIDSRISAYRHAQAAQKKTAASPRGV